jgi:hypothetical protein
VATEIVQAPTSADHAGDTAPLPAAALSALARLHAAFPVVQAVTVYETAAEHAAQLAARAETGHMSDLDADDLAHAEELMAGARATLHAAGRLDLIQPPLSPELERAAVRYSICRDRLTDLEQRTLTTAAEFDQLASAQDGLTAARDVLVKAGRLDLIGGAS